MVTMRIERAKAGWRIWRQWVLANAVGGGVTLALTGAMIRAGRLNAAVVVAVFGLMIGSSLGLAQWPVLRHQISQAYLWVLASVIGGTMSGVVGFAMGGAVGGPLGGAMIGASLGIMQWLVLRRRVSRSYLYLLASVIGFALGLSVGEVVGFTVGGPTGWLLGGTMFGIVAGAITGVALVWLFRQPILER